jgi:acyl-coenzyme A thioesterase PaaI-like protein
MLKLLTRSRKANVIREAWDKLAKIPKGNIVYSQLVGRMVPYTGTIPAVVEALGEGAATVSMRDTRRVRNHLNSIHAVALANLGELSTGLALNYTLPPKARCILVSLRMDYVKKARGTLRATARFEKPEWGPHQEILVVGEIVDAKGDTVAKVTATWLVDAH